MGDPGLKSIIKLRSGAINTRQLATILLFLYFSFGWTSLICVVLFRVMGIPGGGQYLAVFITYVPFFLIVYCKRRIPVSDFWILLACIILFFVLTYLIHPEYAPYYLRSDYGVMNYVLRPDNGIFLYLLLRLIDEPKQILQAIRTSGWLMYILYARQLLEAIARGYWIDTTQTGGEIHLAYNLSFGYRVLIFALVFLYCALEYKKLLDWAGAILGLGMITLGGSRGPFLDIAIFLILYIAIKLSRSRKKGLILLLILAGAVILWQLYEPLLRTVAGIMDHLHLNSRFITMMLEGNITEDTGRETIWGAAIEMIRQHPFRGYGAMGSRHVIIQYIYVAHPHNFFLEIFIDFGVIAGTVIILFLLINAVRILMRNDIGEWRFIFLIFFARSCQLLVSLTFWHVFGFWACLAIGMNIHCLYPNKRKRIRILYHVRQQNK